ncbi:MAG: hypothetical protein ACLGGX_08285 [Bdellovibrionia bacterium]
MAFCEITSNNIIAKVSTKGAELTGLWEKGRKHNWIWPAIEPWARNAPHLFPIVGRLNSDTINFNGQKYRLTQHGFARDLEFSVVDQSESMLHLSLNYNVETLSVYPFRFSFEVIYTATDLGLDLVYRVRNLDSSQIFFNVGWHPAFVLPEQDKLALVVEGNSIFKGRFSLRDGLLDMSSFFALCERRLMIGEDAFAKDAWVIVYDAPETISLSDVSGNSITLRTGGAPFFGLWSKNPSKFLCIEPWWGVADQVDFSGDFNEKFGIQTLASGEFWTTKMTVELRGVK